MMKFLVCYDASPAAKSALDRTLELIRPLRDHIVVLMVAEEPSRLLLTEQTVDRVSAARLQDAQRIVDGINHKLEEKGVISRETIAVPAEDAAQAILDMAERKMVDLLVLGSGSKSAMQSVLLGSVSRRCLDEARVPVLIVRPRDPQASSPSSSSSDAAI